ncbi:MULTISPECIES: hypothetical protein [unclassified Ketobacter]|uniref:hypothetical protein n=1 Tax=unclassified Ketobacter TaxID=2639109 RepID=UPI0025C50777|nr:MULTISPECIES: hypothetical protein [unclassified Ketobacter]
MKIMKSNYLIVTALACSVSFSGLADAQEASPKTAEEIAAELANPNTVLGTMNFNLDYISFDGDLPNANKQSSLRLTFQPSLPYPLDNGMNFFARPAIPIIINQDVPTANGYDDPGFNLGDIGFDVGVGKTFSNGIVAIGGLVGTLPTATDDAYGKDQWALGPEGLLAIVKPWGALGLLVTHQWDVAGDDDVDTNVTAGQYFWVINLKKGWQLRSGPTFAYDHEAESGQRWTLPIGVGINKTMIIGETPWKFGLEYWDYIESPDAFGPDTQIRLVIAPVVPLPW